MIIKRPPIFLLAVFAYLHFGSASAATFSLNPSNATFNQFDSVSVELLASGLADNEVIGTFDITVDYDPTLLLLDDVQFSGALGDPTDPLQTVPLFVDLFVSVAVLNLSILPAEDLAPLQTADPLLLATLNFTAFDLGSSDFTISSSVVNIEVVPIPGAVWLMITGLIGIGAMARKGKSAD